MPDPNARGIKALEDNTRAIIAHTKALEEQTKLLKKLGQRSQSIRLSEHPYLEQTNAAGETRPVSGPTDGATEQTGAGYVGPYGDGVRFGE